MNLTTNFQNTPKCDICIQLKVLCDNNAPMCSGCLTRGITCSYNNSQQKRRSFVAPVSICTDQNVLNNNANFLSTSPNDFFNNKPGTFPPLKPTISGLSINTSPNLAPQNLGGNSYLDVGTYNAINMSPNVLIPNSNFYFSSPSPTNQSSPISQHNFLLTSNEISLSPVDNQTFIYPTDNNTNNMNNTSFDSFSLNPQMNSQNFNASNNGFDVVYPTIVINDTSVANANAYENQNRRSSTPAINHPHSFAQQVNAGRSASFDLSAIQRTDQSFCNVTPHQKQGLTHYFQHVHSHIPVVNLELLRHGLNHPKKTFEIINLVDSMVGLSTLHSGNPQKFPEIASRFLTQINLEAYFPSDGADDSSDINHFKMASYILDQLHSFHFALSDSL